MYVEFSDCFSNDIPSGDLSPLTDSVENVQQGVTDIWEVLTQMQDSITVLTGPSTLTCIMW